MADNKLLEIMIVVAGIGQILLVIGSLAIPKFLNWSGELSKVRPLIKQIFWTYAGYILITNLSFGLLSALAPTALVSGTLLAKCITGFIALYWAARIVIQFTYFDRSDAPKGSFFTFAEVLLIIGFFFFTAVYSAAFYANLNH